MTLSTHNKKLQVVGERMLLGASIQKYHSLAQFTKRVGRSGNPLDPYLAGATFQSLQGQWLSWFSLYT